MGHAGFHPIIKRQTEIAAVEGLSAGQQIDRRIHGDKLADIVHILQLAGKAPLFILKHMVIEWEFDPRRGLVNSLR